MLLNSKQEWNLNKPNYSDYGTIYEVNIDNIYDSEGKRTEQKFIENGAVKFNRVFFLSE